jgi:hypothetical protein
VLAIVSAVGITSIFQTLAVPIAKPNAVSIQNDVSTNSNN